MRVNPPVEVQLELHRWTQILTLEYPPNHLAKYMGRFLENQ